MGSTGWVGGAAASAVALIGVTVLSVSGLTSASGQAAVLACRTSQLRVWRGLPGTAAAGSAYYELQFSNVSSTSCSVRGFPGVSAVTGSGRQVGSPAARDRSFPPTTVVLVPGTTAHAVLRVLDIANYPPATCQPATAAALRIYPPGESTAVMLAFQLGACAAPGPVYLYVRTIRPRAGIPGYSQ